MIPNPAHWYSEQHLDDPDTVSIYDGSDYPIVTVHAREADAEVGMEGYTAMELAEVILTAVDARSRTSDARVLQQARIVQAAIALVEAFPEKGFGRQEWIELVDAVEDYTEHRGSQTAPWRFPWEYPR